MILVLACEPASDQGLPAGGRDMAAVFLAAAREEDTLVVALLAVVVREIVVSVSKRSVES